jgi:hypothetical protein
MIALQLTEAEARALETVIARRVDEMMTELVHTTERAAHAELRTDYEQLEKLQRRLREQSATSPSAPQRATSSR